jgi:hypothetical protein
LQGLAILLDLQYQLPWAFPAPQARQSQRLATKNGYKEFAFAAGANGARETGSGGSRARADRCAGVEGFIPGEQVMLMSRGMPGSGPLVVRVGMSTFALRQAEAACVQVLPLGSGDGAGDGSGDQA